jgi:hypothetical protein
MVVAEAGDMLFAGLDIQNWPSRGVYLAQGYKCLNGLWRSLARSERKSALASARSCSAATALFR